MAAPKSRIYFFISVDFLHVIFVTKTIEASASAVTAAHIVFASEPVVVAVKLAAAANDTFPCNAVRLATGREIVVDFHTDFIFFKIAISRANRCLKLTIFCLILTKIALLAFCAQR
jgi:hypothetical protein